MNLKRGFLNSIILPISIILVISSLTWINIRFNIPISAIDEFKNAWVGANQWLFHGQNPYIAVDGFNLPFTAMIFFAPLGLIDFVLARAIWLTLIESSLFLLIVIGINFSGWKVSSKSLPLVILSGIVWYYGIRAIFLGQFSVLILLVIYGGLFLVQKKQDALGGFILAISISQPETAILLVIFITIWSMAARRYQLLVSMYSGMIFLTLLSIILLPDWPLQWLRVVIGTTVPLILYTSALSKLADMVPGIRLGLSIVLNLSILAFLIIEWVTSIKDAERMFVWLVMITMVVNTLIKLKSNPTDLIGLLPVFFYILMVIQSKWKTLADRVAVLVFISLVAFPWLNNLILLHQGIKETSAYTLALSILCVIVLVWIKRWAHQSQRLPLEVYIERIS